LISAFINKSRERLKNQTFAAFGHIVFISGGIIVGRRNIIVGYYNVSIRAFYFVANARIIPFSSAYAALKPPALKSRTFLNEYLAIISFLIDIAFSKALTWVIPKIVFLKSMS
jgi:hypothetical protein